MRLFAASMRNVVLVVGDLPAAFRISSQTTHSGCHVLDVHETPLGPPSGLPLLEVQGEQEAKNIYTTFIYYICFFFSL